jgi:hypothetical protein
MPIVVLSEARRRDEVARADRSEALDRRHRRVWWKMLAGIVGWNLVGMTLIGFGLATTDAEAGGRWLVAGLSVGYIGMVGTLFFQVLGMME